ncbi:MAG: ribosomal protein L7/L12 [Jeotgalicoccus sp.]
MIQINIGGFIISSFIIIIIAGIIILGLSNSNKKLQQAAFRKAIQNPDLSSTVRSMDAAGKTDVQIIKYIREETGLGLVYAKNLLEEIETGD